VKFDVSIRTLNPPISSFSTEREIVGAVAASTSCDSPIWAKAGDAKATLIAAIIDANTIAIFFIIPH
jgi:hypothetical protein